MLDAYVVDSRMILSAGEYRQQLTAIIGQWEQLESLVKSVTRGTADFVKVLNGMQKIAGVMNPMATASAQMSKAATDMAAAMPNVARQAEATANSMERAASASRQFTLQWGPYGPPSPSAPPRDMPRLTDQTNRASMGALVPYSPPHPGASQYYGGDYGGRGASYDGGPARMGNKEYRPEDGLPVVQRNLGLPISLPTLGPRPSGGDFAMAAVGYGIVGRALTGFTGDVIHAGMDYGHQLTMLRAMGWNDADIAAASRTAMDAQRDILGVTPAGALAAEHDIFTITRNKKEALSLTPDLLRASTVLSEVGKGDQLTNLFKALQAGELRGVISETQIPEFLRYLESAAVSTGGRIGPAEFLKFLQNSGAAGRALDMSNLFGSLIPTMLSMTSGRAGTALQGFYRQFGAEKMSQASGNMLRDMGLLVDPTTGAPLTDKQMKADRYGIAQYMFKPGELRGGDLINQGKDAEFMETVLLPAIKKWNIAHYGYDDINLEAQTGMRIASTTTGSKELADFFSLLPLSGAYQNAVQQGTTRDAYRTFASTDPTLKAAGLQASWTGFLTSLSSGPVMEVAMHTLGNVTDGLNALGRFADEHKALASVLVGVAAALGTLAVAASAISGALFLAGPMSRVGKWATSGDALIGGGLAGGALGAGALAGAAAKTVIRKAFWPVMLGSLLWDANPHGNWTTDTAWSPLHPFTLDHWHDGAWDSDRSAVPPSTSSSGASNGPVPVYVVNPGGVSGMVTGQIANQGQLPRSDPTSAGPRATIPQPGVPWSNW